MRRGDREVKEIGEIIRIMEGCDVCRLAFHGEDCPYILPLNFGMEVREGRITLYFHGAAEGTKYRLLARDNRVSFEMDRGHELVFDRERGYRTMRYESVIGRGRLQVVEEEEKLPALSALMAHYHGGDAAFNPAAIPRTTVLKLAVEEATGKVKR